MGVIATLLPNPVSLQRLRAAIRDRHELVPCATWEAVAEACETHAVRTAVVDLYATGDANFEQLRQLKQRWPGLSLLSYSTITLDRVSDVFDAGRMGVDALVVADQDDSPRQLLARIERAESRSLGGEVRLALDEVDPGVRDAVLLVITRAHERLSPAGLARLLALPRRTMSQRLAVAGYPPPRRLLTWGRLIVAARMLEDPRRTADRVASNLGFPSGSAFRNVCQRYLHLTPGEIRQRGGAAHVVRALLNEVETPATDG
ncbi:MAG TPA: helix-turn-helix domain-containing protein [Gemmatimonadaceae bacterium]|nr:helix-turn-helix domain-containing protein [Gemmatimonadaceae bacterium]